MAGDGTAARSYDELLPKWPGVCWLVALSTAERIAALVITGY